MKKILFNTTAHADALLFVEKAGYEPVVVPERDFDASRRIAPECVGMVTNAQLPIDDDFFRLASQMKVVGRMGVGYDNVDVEAARRHGVRVVNTPLPIIEPVAEHTIALLLAVARNIVNGDRATRDGSFRHAAILPGAEVAGKTLGIVGLGNTGARVAEIAHLAFRMQVVYCDQVERLDVEQRLDARRLALGDLLRESDYVSVHVNLSAATRNMLGAPQFALMKPTACLINVSRGPVIDEDALVDALRSGQIATAGLDVFVEEPLPTAHPLCSMHNVVLTPHVAGYSDEARRGTSMVVEDLVRVLAGEEPRFPVA